MINKDELLFTVDENNSPITPLPRHHVHANNIWHRTCHVWITNNRGQILCQKRSLLKDKAPGKWESFFGGHLPPNETYLKHAVTELSEELGINVEEKDLQDLFNYKEGRGFEFQEIFVLSWDGDIKSIKLEPDEVDQVKWVDKNEVKKYIEDTVNWSQVGYAEKIFNNI